MKKVKTNKLKLNKETLTNLQMGSVAGGLTDPNTKAKTCAFTCGQFCVPPTQLRCPSHPYCTV